MIDKYINDPQSFADWQNNTRALKARIDALEQALRNTLSLLPASIATNFNEDGTHNDSAYDIISNAHNLLEKIS